MSIEVWIADLNLASSTLTPEDFSLLCARERELAGRYRLERDRLRYVLSRVLLREAVSHVSGGDPRELRFVYDRGAKPRLVAEQAARYGVHFNISHAGDAVVVAVSTTSEVGVDVEPLTGPAADSACDATLFESVFSERELDSLQALPESSRREDTLRMWTVKEAYAKLLGVDADLDVYDIEIARAPWRIAREPERSGARQARTRVETRELELGGQRYHVALASRAPRTLSQAAVLRLVG